MSDQTSIFGNNQNSGDPANQNGGTSNPNNAQLNAQVADLLNGIKNERGEPKYKTLEDALVGLKNAQDYIPTLKNDLTARDTELATLREQVKKVTELEETVRRLTSDNQNQGTPPKGMTAEEIAAQVEQAVNSTLTAREQKATQERNTETVVKALTAKFGKDAEAKFVARAAELGITVQEFNRLAANTPAIVLTAMGVTGTQQTPPAGSQAPSGSSVNTSGIPPRNESLVGRNTKGVLVGATTEHLNAEFQASKQMVEELAQQGLSVHDLTDPKVYRKHFG